MVNVNTQPLLAPTDTIRVNVAYYDKAEQAAFTEALGRDILDGPTREVIIPTPDFCTYYQYYKLRKGVLGYSSHAEMAKRWFDTLHEWGGQVEFVDGSIRLVEAKGTSRGTTERLGEAIGLSVASSLHDLHEGDWARIPETNARKTFDFKYPLASDGQRFIEVEAKGAAVENNRLKPPSVSTHKRSIKEKKWPRPRKRETTRFCMAPSVRLTTDRRISHNAGS